MDLKIRDLVELLQVSEKTIYRWLKEKKIPAYRINHQFRFSKAEINEWLLQNRIEVSDRILALKLTALPVNLAEMARRGGVFYDLPGGTPGEAIRHAVGAIKLPAGADRARIIEVILQREGMMSTAVGRGIALPHSRNPILTDSADAEVSIFFLREKVDFQALDGEPVHTMFIALTANPKRHLEVLSKISYFCQRDDFRALLETRAPADVIFSFLADIERDLPRKGPPS
ncbi:MAG: PTS sugar transporter subunit IIA [Spirochaetales bacterium]|nr:PTS sugar transporter subunit IIA [Spirochaetales bacterium]